MAYSVSQRRHEIGVRMALGASQASVVGLTLKRAFWLTAIGIVIGAVPAVGLAGVIRTVLFGVVSAQPAMYAGIVALLAVTTAVAGLVPARQASRVDPATALRRE
jgi:putative ABC transport system permease protein